MTDTKPTTATVSVVHDRDCAAGLNPLIGDHAAETLENIAGAFSFLMVTSEVLDGMSDEAVAGLRMYYRMLQGAAYYESQVFTQGDGSAR